MRMAELPKSALQNFARRLDGWENNVTGFGTTRDKTIYGEFAPFLPLTDPQLANLYHGSDIVGRVIDVVPQEMLREGFEVDLGDPKINTLLSAKLTEIDARKNLLEGTRWGRLYGGAAILLGADDGRPAEMPLVPERAKDLTYLYVIDRRYLWPMTFYGVGPKMGQPETFMASPPSARVYVPQMIVHESRLVLFGGAPTGIREREQYTGWDYSILQRLVETIRQFDTGWKAVEILLTDGNQGVFKMSGLAEVMASGEKDVLKQRLELIDMARSVLRAIVVDAGTQGGDEPESFERQNTTYTGIADVLDKFMLRLASAVQIPVTILMGQSPAGMNATGDSDFRWFYDRIRAEQNNELAPKIKRIVDVWLSTKSSPMRTKPDTVTVKFPALWTETPLAEAQRRLAIAQADSANVAAGIYLPEEVALNRSRPEGYGDQMMLTDEARKARETVIQEELAKITGKGEDVAAGKVELAPTDIAKVITVNEARQSQGLDALKLPDGGADPDGDLTVAEFTALREASSISKNAPDPTPPLAPAFAQAEPLGAVRDPFSAPAPKPAPAPLGKFDDKVGD